jgi:hypothetical protein
MRALAVLEDEPTLYVKTVASMLPNEELRIHSSLPMRMQIFDRKTAIWASSCLSRSSRAARKKARPVSSLVVVSASWPEICSRSAWMPSSLRRIGVSPSAYRRMFRVVPEASER